MGAGEAKNAMDVMSAVVVVEAIVAMDALDVRPSGRADVLSGGRCILDFYRICDILN